jgi:segregation and condensation protein B
MTTEPFDQDYCYEAMLAMLFAAGIPVPIKDVCQILKLSEKDLADLIDQEKRQSPHAAFIIQRHEAVLQLATNPHYAREVKQILNLEHAKELSPSAKETLAIIAYKQPIDRASIEAIRGIDCRRPLQSLVQKGLIEPSSKTPPGGDPRSFFYEVSMKFLEYFGLTQLEELKQRMAPQDSQTREA